MVDERGNTPIDELFAQLRSSIASFDADTIVDLVKGLHEADLGDFLESLSVEEQRAFVELCGEKFNLLVLTEVETGLRIQVLSWLSSEQIVQALSSIETDDAVQILTDLPVEKQEEILSLLPAFIRAVLRRSLSYPQKTAGRRMQTDFVAVPPFWTVEQTVSYIRDSSGITEDFYEIFLLDPAFRPIATVPLNRLLRTANSVQMETIADDNICTVDAFLDQEEVARTFKRYDLVSAPVTDDSGRLVGVITVDDIIDVLDEELEEDFRRLAGVSGEEISDLPISTVISRFPWLFFGLFTAIFASWVISLFGDVLQQMVVLAVLMPIVASIGGNAGTQTMTITVRALSTDGWEHFSILRNFTREVVGSLLNGCIFAAILLCVISFWFGSTDLGIVIGVAVIINFLAAGTFGLFIPVMLYKLRLDPAIASASFMAMVTDVVGFLSFLGLGAWWFDLL